MKGPTSFRVSYADDDSWRRELCPDCGMRLYGLAAWKDHGPRHSWGSEWLAARIHAAFPGEKVKIDPRLLDDASVVETQTVDDATWKLGIQP